MAALFRALLFCFPFVLLCGDVEQNPGPGIRYPCSLCCRPVCRNQKALLCDLCQQWAHCKCCSVDNHAYAAFQTMECFSWCCPRCLVGTRGPTPAKILYEISKSQNFWQDFRFLAFHFKDILFIFVVLSLKL